MPHDWPTITLTTDTEAIRLLSDMQGKRWLLCGQSKRYGSLVPSIDREPRQKLLRADKLNLERRSIDLFRSTARFFADAGERGSLDDDVVALMVLRHYGVPTRLLDWSWSPWIAAYFAVQSHERDDGEIWAFDEPLYEEKGKKQWRQWPETTSDGTGDPTKFRAGLTAFTLNEPPNWFICGFYSPGFHRQNAQQSVYTMTAQFGRDHTEAIADLLREPSHYHLFVVSAGLKPKLRQILLDNHGVWRGSLFPDSAGAAATAGNLFLENRV